MSDTKESNPKDRAGTCRLDTSLWPDTATCYGALAMQEGDFKYGGYNYRSIGVRASVYRASMQRHLDKWWNGEDEDPITKVPHLGSVLAGGAVLIDAIESGMLDDDRPPPVKMTPLFERFEAKVKHLRDLFLKPTSPARYRAKPSPPPNTGPVPLPPRATDSNFMNTDGRVHAVLGIMYRQKDSKMLSVWNSKYECAALPGGKREANETPIAALFREIGEETSIRPDACTFVYEAEWGPDKHLVRTYIVSYRGIPKQGREVTSIDWVTPRELFEDPNSPFKDYYRGLFAALALL